MKTLNPNSTRTFCQLIRQMEGKEHLKIENEPFMALTIERLAQDILIEGHGEASLYSLAHYYPLNGDLMSDPEMTFLVIAEKQDPAAWDGVKIMPRSFCQSDMGIYEESIIFLASGQLELNSNMQYQHTEFADVWLGNIKVQEYIKRP